MQQRKSDSAWRRNCGWFFSPLGDDWYFPGTAPGEEAPDEAELLPSLEALIQAVLNSNAE
jgi:hypothetical protein